MGGKSISNPISTTLPRIETTVPMFGGLDVSFIFVSALFPLLTPITQKNCVNLLFASCHCLDNSARNEAVFFLSPRDEIHLSWNHRIRVIGDDTLSKIGGWAASQNLAIIVVAIDTPGN